MPHKWDAASERNLLLAAIAAMGAPPATIWDAVADKLSAEGAVVNGNACSQKFYKLKKQAEEMLGGADVGAANGDAATPVKKTPIKRKRKAENDGEGDGATPTKRTKAKKAAPVAPEVKEEAEAEAEVTPAVKDEDGEGATAE